MVYGRTTIEPGEYNFIVSRDDEGWYGIDGQDSAFKTSGCYSLVEYVAATATIEEGGKGRLAIPSEDEECRIEGVYSKTELEIVTE